jgi:hypothetical protein
MPNDLPAVTNKFKPQTLEEALICLSHIIAHLYSIGISKRFDETFNLDYIQTYLELAKNDRRNAALDWASHTPISVQIEHLFTHGYPDVALRIQAFLAPYEQKNLLHRE